MFLAPQFLYSCRFVSPCPKNLQQLLPIDDEHLRFLAPKWGQLGSSYEDGSLCASVFLLDLESHLILSNFEAVAASNGLVVSTTVK